LEYNLLSNAANSLRIGLTFYRKYINLQDQYFCDEGNLKMTVICVHHAAELLLKRFLSDINELLIISDFKEKGFFEFYGRIIRESENGTKKVPLFHFMNGDSDFHTIKYFELINRYQAIYNMNTEDVEFLSDLGKYRNRLMHMGIDKRIDFYEVLISINGTLSILKEVMTKIKPYYRFEKKCLNGINKRIDEITNLSLNLIDDTWEAFWNECFEDMENCFIDLKENIDFKAFLDDNNLKMDIEGGDYRPSTYFKITFTSKINHKNFVLLTENISKYSVTLFKYVDLNERVCFVYCHKYLSDEDRKRTNFIVLSEMPLKTESRFWLDIAKDKKKNLRFSFETLKRELEELIKNEICPKLEN